MINLITDAGLRSEVKEGKVDMCRAIQKLRAEERAMGVEQGITQGIAQGHTQGWDEHAVKTAAAMILDGMPVNLIMKYSNLPLEKIQEQARKMNKVLN